MAETRSDLVENISHISSGTKQNIQSHWWFGQSPCAYDNEHGCRIHNPDQKPIYDPLLAPKVPDDTWLVSSEVKEMSIISTLYQTLQSFGCPSTRPAGYSEPVVTASHWSLCIRPFLTVSPTTIYTRACWMNTAITALLWTYKFVAINMFVSSTGNSKTKEGFVSCQHEYLRPESLPVVGRKVDVRFACYKDLGTAEDRFHPQWRSHLTPERLRQRRLERPDLYLVTDAQDKSGLATWYH
ncbi:hypothetical protein PG995_007039 [Apiospora arundinis]